MYQDQSGPLGAGDASRHDVEFEGTMGGFVGLAAVNMLLTIITFGIYRFWAKTQVRRYLWGNTRFDGEPLEYRGRGVELLIGALIAFGVILVPLFIVSSIAAALQVQGQIAVAGLLQSVTGLGLLYLIGVGLYRSQRYLLSRTSWRGVRGGMMNGGWAYGGLYLVLTFMQGATLGLATPYVSTRLWNLRMNDAMFGSFSFQADATWKPLFGRFVAALLAAAALTGLVVYSFWSTISGVDEALKTPGADIFGAVASFYGVMLLLGVGIALIMANYTAFYWRHVIAATSLDGLSFRFEASTGDWVRYYVVNALIVVLTLGLGLLVMPFRTWSFFIGHLETEGALDTDAMLQTTLEAPRQGDGIADAFDLAAV